MDGLGMEPHAHGGLFWRFHLRGRAAQPAEPAGSAGRTAGSTAQPAVAAPAAQAAAATTQPVAASTTQPAARAVPPHLQWAELRVLGVVGIRTRPTPLAQHLGDWPQCKWPQCSTLRDTGVQRVLHVRVAPGGGLRLHWLPVQAAAAAAVAAQPVRRELPRNELRRHHKHRPRQAVLAALADAAQLLGCSSAVRLLGFSSVAWAGLAFPRPLAIPHADAKQQGGRAPPFALRVRVRQRPVNLQ